MYVSAAGDSASVYLYLRGGGTQAEVDAGLVGGIVVIPISPP